MIPTDSDGLSFKRLVQFAMGNAGKNALASMIEIYGLYYCIELLGVPPSLAGAVILVSLAWDAVADPLIGYRADRQISRASIDPPVLRGRYPGLRGRISDVLQQHRSTGISAHHRDRCFVDRIPYRLHDHRHPP